MITTLRETKTRLSELVNLADAGEEIVITVHGKPKARLVGVAEPDPDTKEWMKELAALRGTPFRPVADSTVLDDVREDRW